MRSPGHTLAPTSTRPPAANPAPRVAAHIVLTVAVAVAGGVERVAAGSSPPTAADHPYAVEAGPAPSGALASRFSPIEIEVLESLNRADVRALSRLETLIVPQTWHADPIAYSPFPARYESWGAGFSKLIVVHQPSQAFAAYESGRLVRWGPVSTGARRSQTPAGLFHLNWRSPGRHSTIDPSWFLPWYFNFHSLRGLSFHQYALPGRPASHACVRMLRRDAEWLFHWGEGWQLDPAGRNVLATGTPVLVLGCYDFDAEPPWRSPEWLARGIELPDDPDPSRYACTP